jgi:16S rRNA (adenine1518-N6/adenine1519-N6)-dimethyltransferase
VHEKRQTGHVPRKRFGQNFLHDKAVLQRIIDVIGLNADDHVVEIGAGKGALTQALLVRSAHVDLLELDRDLVPYLREKFRATAALHIHNADALSFDFCQLSRPKEKLRVIGNLPYNISTPLLFHLLDQTECIGDMHFMLQKEVAERLVAQPGTAAYGRLSLMMQYRCNVELLFTVPPGSFYPVPKVNSAFVCLSPHTRSPVELADEESFKQVVTQAFSQRRKTIRNSLKGMLTAEQIMTAGIDPGLRAEALSLEQFARLSNTASEARQDTG